MNNSFTILTFFKMIKKNIVLFLSVFILFTVIGIVAGSVIYTNSYTITVTCSLSIVDNKNTQGSTIDYTTQYYDNAASFIKDNALLKETADVYNIKLKDLANDITYSRSFGVINITYTTETSNEAGTEILMSVVNHWSNFVASSSFSGIKGNAEVILGPIVETDLTIMIVVFILAFAVVGFVLGVVVATIKSFYSKTIIDRVFIEKSINIPIVADNKNVNLLYKNLILNASRTNSKVICISTNDGVKRNKITNALIEELNNNNYTTKLLDFSFEINDECKDIANYVYNFKTNNPLQEKLASLKNQYDYIIINAPDNEAKFALNKISDLTVIDIEINKTIRKKLKTDLYVMEKDNNNIIGVIVE